MFGLQVAAAKLAHKSINVLMSASALCFGSIAPGRLVGRAPYPQCANRPGAVDMEQTQWINASPHWEGGETAK